MAVDGPFPLSLLFRRRRRCRRKRAINSSRAAAAHLSSLSPSLPSIRLQALPGQVTPEGVPSFKLVLVGDGGTGKWESREGKKKWRKEEERKEERKKEEASSLFAFLVCSWCFLSLGLLFFL